MVKRFMIAVICVMLVGILPLPYSSHLVARAAPLRQARPAPTQIYIEFLARNFGNIRDGFERSQEDNQHAFMRITRVFPSGEGTKVDYYGFTQDSTNNYAIVFQLAHGYVTSEIDGPYRESYPYVIKNLTPAQYQTVMERVRSWHDDPPNYGFFTRNCIHFVADVARRIGLYVPDTYFTQPEDFMQNLMRLNPSDVRTEGRPQHRLLPGELENSIRLFDYRVRPIFNEASVNTGREETLTRNRDFSVVQGQRDSLVAAAVQTRESDRLATFTRAQQSNQYAANKTRIDADAARRAVEGAADAVRGGATPQTGTAPPGSQANDPSDVDTSCGFLCIRAPLPPHSVAPAVRNAPANMPENEVPSMYSLAIGSPLEWQEADQLIAYVGPMTLDQTKSFTLSISTSSPSPHNLALLASDGLEIASSSSLLPNNAVRVVKGTNAEVAVTLRTPKALVSSEASPLYLLEIAEEGVVVKRVYFLFDVFTKPEIAIHLQTGPWSSGLGKDYSEWYQICSGKSPLGFELTSAAGWITSWGTSHPRDCGAWSECSSYTSQTDGTCLRFKAQGHDGGTCIFCENPGKHTLGIMGNLSLVYRMVDVQPYWMDRNNLLAMGDSQTSSLNLEAMQRQLQYRLAYCQLEKGREHTPAIPARLLIWSDHPRDVDCAGMNLKAVKAGGAAIDDAGRSR